MNKSVTPAVDPSSTAPLLPLFPLRMVLFPGGLLGLQVFEPRYLDLATECLRSGAPFGVIGLRLGAEVGRGEAVSLEDVGTLAHIDDVDAEQANLLRLRCTGGQRFRLAGKPQRRPNGLWECHTEAIADDPVRLPGPAMMHTVNALAEAIKKLQLHDQVPFAPPYRLDDAGWLANRWCELLPITLAAKQKLMAMEDPVIRLSLVDGFLRDKKVVVG